MTTRPIDANAASTPRVDNHNDTRRRDKAANVTMPGNPMLLTVEEACRTLRISKWMLYRLIHTRQLTTVKIGRRRFVDAEDLQALISKLRQAEDV